jgi:type II secretory pathway component PulM
MSASSVSILDQLNLTPQERRIVVGLAVLVFVVLNLLLVWPHFKDLAQVRQHLDDTRRTMANERSLILKDIDPSPNGYQKHLNELQRQQGGGIIGTHQIQLQKTVSDQAIKTGVTVGEIKPVTVADTQSNAFYEEQSVKISFETMEPNLVNFLVTVGNDPVIRVRELSLRTVDANRYRLKGDAILSANYAKETPKPAAPPPPPRPGAAAPAAKTIPGQPPSPNPRTVPGAQPGRKNL